MRLKITTSSIVLEKTVVTPLIQHNNNWPSSSVEACDSGNEDEQRQLGNIIHSSTAIRSPD